MFAIWAQPYNTEHSTYCMAEVNKDYLKTNTNKTIQMLKIATVTHMLKRAC